MPGTVFSAWEMSSVFLLHEVLGEGSRCSLSLEQAPVVHSGCTFTDGCFPREMGSLLPQFCVSGKGSLCLVSSLL